MLTYPPFEPHFPREAWSLPAVLEHQAATRPDAPFLTWTDEGRPLSFAQVNRHANRLARGFARRGVREGDMVVVFLPNCLEFVLTWFALSKLGAIEVAVGESSKGFFLEHQLRLAQPKLVVTTPDLAVRLVDARDAIEGDWTCVLVASPTDAPRGAFALPGVEVEPFEALQAEDERNIGLRVRPEQPAAVLFTSGTTGPSKGVVMSHAQFYFFAEEDVQLTGLDSTDVYLTGFPLSHGNAQFLTVYPCLIAGARCVLYSRFSAGDFIGRARRSGATVTNLLGATMAFVCAQPPGRDDRDHAIRCIYAAPLPPELAPVFEERFGISHFVNGFGQTEISLPFMTPPGATPPPGACGVQVSQWFDVRLADPETGRDVPEGQAGELLVRPVTPDIVCLEYLGMPEATTEARRGGWFHTGDSLRRDPQGWVYFVDRVKDAIRRRGENISSFEVEAVVRSHPAVAECAAVAVQAEAAGGEDEIKACIVPMAGSKIAFADLIAWCDARMPAYMVPRYIEVFKALPQTPSEKVRKKELRDQGITVGTWDRIVAGCMLTDEKMKQARRR